MARPSRTDSNRDLLNAIDEADVPAIRRLLESGANANQACEIETKWSTKERSQPLDRAIDLYCSPWQGAPKRLDPRLVSRVVGLLLEAGARVNPEAVCLAAAIGRRSLLSRLLKASGNPNSRITRSNSYAWQSVPAMICVLHSPRMPGHVSKAKLLLDAGANPCG